LSKDGEKKEIVVSEEISSSQRTKDPQDDLTSEGIEPTSNGISKAKFE
jgi:hypothetical protein